MKLTSFKKLFPNADMSMFKEIDGSVVWGKYNDDVEEPSFWDNVESVFDLHLSFDDMVTYYKDKKLYLEKVRHAVQLEKSKPQPWEPIEWSSSSSFSIETIKREKNTINLEKFRIYVNEKDFFVLQEKFPDFSSVSKIDFKDQKNIYTIF